MRESAAPQIDVDAIERQTLRFVNGKRPGKPQRELLECACNRLNHFLCSLIEGVAPAFPRNLLNLEFPPADFDKHLPIGKPRNPRDCTVNPSTVRVIAQQDHLCARFQDQKLIGWLRGGVEFARYTRLVSLWPAGQGVEISHY